MLNLAHKKLDLHQLTLKFVREIYQITKMFPKEEQFGLVSQLRRAAISVCSNFAEGAARKTNKEKMRFYEISRSSLVEVDTQIEISTMLEYVNTGQIVQVKEYGISIFKILSKFITNLGSESN